MEALRHQLQRLQRPIDLVQSLHENQIKEVPARYILPSARRPNAPLTNYNGSQWTFPVVDLTASDNFHGRSKIVNQLAEASQDWGFFQVINHGIPLSLLEKVKQVSKEFFDLPVEEKQRKQCPVRLGHNMLEGYGRFFDISDDTVLEWVDNLVHFIYPPSVREIQHWPTKPAAYRETYEQYGEEVLKLTNKLMALLSEGLGLPPDYIQNLHKDPQLQLRINYYPPCPQPDLVNGIKPHSDGSTLTVLIDDGVEGLQIRKDGGWFTVPPLPGSLTVNAGDMLQIISNGKYRSAEHRAIVNEQQCRMSIVMFLMPREDVIVCPAAELVDETHPPLYKSTTSGEYVTKYMSHDLQGKEMLDGMVFDRVDTMNV